MKTQREIIFILGSLLIVSIAWVIFNIQHNAQTSTISEALNHDITAITAHFNIAVITKLKNRELVNPSYTYISVSSSLTTNNQATIAATPTVSLTPSPSLAETVIPTPTEAITITP